MRKLIFATLAVATLATTSIASAAEFSTTGVVEDFNAATKTVQLKNGDAYKLPSNTDLNGLSVGQKVRINWSAQSPSWFQDHLKGEDTYVALVDADSIQPAS